MSCLYPFRMVVPTENAYEMREVFVPCGRCVLCRKRKQSEWQFRLTIEQMCSYNTLFVTLTYRDDCLPLKGVQKDHCQKFIKRYRKSLQPGQKISYFLVSEYGSETSRPHYHLIIFYKWRIHLYEESTRLLNSWKMGAIKIGTCTSASIAYCTKYMMKDRTDNNGLFDNHTFALMSRRPAIGIEYLCNGEVGRLHEETLDFRVITPDGILLNMPRYYRDKLFDDFDKWLNRSKLADDFEKYEEELMEMPIQDMNVKYWRLERKQKQKNKETDKL